MTKSPGDGPPADAGTATGASSSGCPEVEPEGTEQRDVADVVDVPIGTPLSPEELRRLKEAASRPDEEDE